MKKNSKEIRPIKIEAIIVIVISYMALSMLEMPDFIILYFLKLLEKHFRSK